MCLMFWLSEEHPLGVEDPKFGHEVEIDKGQADQEVLHQVKEGRDKAKEGNKTNTHKEEGQFLQGHS